MEKVGALISRLQQQYAVQADEASLLNTALMLVAELQNSHDNRITAGKVTVITPYKPFEIIAEDKALAEPVKNEIKEEEAPPVITEETPVQEEMPDQEEEPVQAEQITVAEAQMPETPAQDTIITAEPVQDNPLQQSANESYNVIEEVPTLTQQQPRVFYQLNGNTSADEQLSINDKLKIQATETGGKLQAEPIKDLRKAIGINDKFLFTKELFRNDETAYERSIKTINNFNVLQEAEYWMQREMKYKLGWDDNNPTVKAFYLLVKRRFS